MITSSVGIICLCKKKYEMFISSETNIVLGHMQYMLLHLILKELCWGPTDKK
jgi:hypothetical protein